MNRLLNKAPTTVTIADVEYEINTDFRDCLFTIEQLQDSEFFPEEKAEILITNMYLCLLNDDEDNLTLHIYQNINEAIRKAIWFLQRGKDIEEDEDDETKTEPILFDFSKDSNDIYDAFEKSGLDLDTFDIHWWKFISRFTELPESKFTRKIYLRSQFHDGKLSREEEKECDRIGWDLINLKTKSDELNHELIQELFNHGR